ncbi:hypothetical protein JL722_4310 [Aureococcus anophagefferens]|nr:hypothetical protein JL722_4310 [Aureococcus anophagefferens]
MRKVLVQLDYYLGGQFAGLTSGLARGAFAARGLDNSLAAAAPVKAFGAMFDRSPLAVVAKRGAALRKVAVHADSAELVAEALGVDVVVVERADEAHRAALLAGGAVDGVQCYHTTEPLAFFAPGGGLDAREHEVKSICATAPGSLGALDLGYSQALFADADAPQATLDAFLAALMEGWAIAAEDPILAGEVLAAHEAADDAALFGGAGRDALFHGAVAARCAPAALRMAAAGGRVDGNRWRRVDDALAAAIGKRPSQRGAPLPAVAAPALGHALAGRDATVTLCHAATPDGVREKALEEADFVFAAAGRPGLVGAGDVKRGAAVVNVGTTYDASAKTLAPDVDDAVADDAPTC